MTRHEQALWAIHKLLQDPEERTRLGGLPRPAVSHLQRIVRDALGLTAPPPRGRPEPSQEPKP
jgi:hypothetical protein